MKLYKINYFALFAFTLLLITNSNAQKVKWNNYNNSWLVGYQLNDFSDDFGIGLHVITPRFIGNTHLRISYDYQWLEYMNNNADDWEPYQQVRVDAISKYPIIEKRLLVYGGGGFVVGFLPSKMSSTSVGITGSGTFGLEMFWSPSFSYFLEMGGTGSVGTSDKLSQNRIIGSGFYSSTGFRIYF